MNLKQSLILLTIVSVICDTMLLPFYPHFFSQAFGIDSPQHVGYYIAACCFTVMVAFPLWAKVAKKIQELHLWVYTQIIAGCLGVACYYSTSIVEFWILSQLMLVFKASYLLIYPFVMRLEEKDKHLGMVGLFSVLMHFGGIGGALVGGLTLQIFEPRDIYLIMASGDGLQVLVCLYLINREKVPFKPEAEPSLEVEEASDTDNKVESKPRNILFVYKLGAVSLMLYFSAFLIRPFFARYWESISAWNSEVFTGFVYSIPGWVALLALWINHRSQSKNNNHEQIILAFFVGMLGLFLQGSQQDLVVFAGRCIFGWAMFQATVRLEVLLFELSSPESYGSDFSKIHFFQNFGVILSSFAIGWLVDVYSYQMSFVVAFFGFVLTAVVFYWLFRQQMVVKSAST
ncbi:MFS transporter [Pleionea sp. CnH1-48]|uniref:MFS transporter n=1 Tax=Pleionea sp. CnH1-48 TaxID=2954494 RepID=UPI002097AEF7|nr:MFS transporter [Pleionea sp. CnH1-48]MCO7224563.1 MFS transporter [Pleionea sp. CnH1-48]